MPAKLKICGLKRREDAEYLNEASPDFAGFVFAGAKRKIDFETAKALREILNPEIKTVGVFVNEDIGFIQRLADNHIIDFVQLHGDEDNDYIGRLRKVCNLPIIKAQRIASREDIKPFDADYYLFDTKRTGEYGGTGESFDWSVLLDIEKPFFLAGGINLSNLDEALRIAEEKSAFALDISSGVETDGFKDKQKIQETVRRVRNYEQQCKH
ncbi:MAG: phosphoribosylanthranilate isomerase [Oscillospiraceae bacterium]|nr:phosphoribosylanthranilate isomerase [Oscillospiraceae bacterium]